METKKIRMNPSVARKIHNMRRNHISYSKIHKELNIKCKRSSMQGYYYIWMKTNNIKPWGK